jgi:hypothetical protein
MSDRGAAKELKITKKIFTDTAKRRQLNGTIATGSTPITIYSGRFTARSFIISNPTAGSITFQILDGTTTLVSGTISANGIWNMSDADLPFYTSVIFNASAATVIFTSGGFVP